MRPAFQIALLVASLATAAHAQLKPPAGAGAAQRAAPTAPAAAPASAANADVKKDTEKETAGKMAAHGWLALLDRKDWGTAWDTSAGMFRQTVPLPSWMDAIPKAREPFGPFVQREAAESTYKTTLAGRPVGHYVTTNFLSKFEKKEVVEVVTTMLDTDGRWRVTGYTYTER